MSEHSRWTNYGEFASNHPQLNWYEVPRGWSDVIRCLVGRHKVINEGYDGTAYYERCSCGGIRMTYWHEMGGYNFAPWINAKPFERRRRGSRS